MPIPNTGTFQVPRPSVIKGQAESLLEEMWELLDGMGVEINNGILTVDRKKVDLVKFADGVADVSVVITGLLVLFGIKDKELLEVVDASNLKKGPNFSKPEGWKRPNVLDVLLKQKEVTQ